jgi:hypothetical protein
LTNADQAASPFVAMMQSADLRYGGDTSLLLRVHEGDAGTPRKSLLPRANLDEGNRKTNSREHRLSLPVCGELLIRVENQ